ncbi:925_t:CDS:2 [Ambispora gerdemannii]|uniref:General transcription and DNA repair factor IIH n=1 Tax=Ambispora gerdemannii TaxID=144530 RepID=A0A9N8VM83_9GLOM|nr:925_t:CDS:2 [Ambispora gerdemannii]
MANLNPPVDIDDEAHVNDQQVGYAWEDYKRSWDELQEDADGSLKSIVEKQINRGKRKRHLRDTSTIQRGILRHMFIVIDLSEVMLEKDLRPSRLELTLSYTEQFIQEYFDQNPISQVGIIVTKDGIAQKLTELSGNPMDHIRALQNKKNTETEGEPSLQNALDLARSTLIYVPAHGSREILVIFGSLSTCDPDNIYNTIDQLVKDSIRVSVVGLAAEVQICTYGVVLNEVHFKELLFEIIPPPAITSAQYKSELIMMGFPTHVTRKTPTQCMCHGKSTLGGYLCPRCQSTICELPSECDLCGLTLVSSPHLARSYHHLFPVGNFVEVPWSSASSTECFSCLLTFLSIPSTRSNQQLPEISSGRYKCLECNNHFCIDCDVFIHDVLHNCPGCLSKSESSKNKLVSSSSTPSSSIQQQTNGDSSHNSKGKNAIKNRNES